jgi:hypothetical protein
MTAGNPVRVPAGPDSRVVSVQEPSFKDATI